MADRQNAGAREYLEAAAASMSLAAQCRTEFIRLQRIRAIEMHSSDGTNLA